MAYTEKTKTLTMPMVPLKGTVVFPGLPITLEVSNKRSIECCNSASGDDGYILLIAQRDPEKEWADDIDDFYRVGTVAKINKINKNKSGITIYAEGICRGELVSISRMDVSYASVICRTFNFDPDSIKAQALLHEIIRLFDEFSKNVPGAGKDIENHIRMAQNPALIADMIAATLLVKFEDKQDILEEFEPMRRLELLIYKMQNELDLLNEELDIHRKVRKRIDENQREYYMREQMKVLKEELGEDDRSDDDDYREYAERIIMNVDLPEKIAEKLLKEAEKLTKMPYGSSERSVILNYLDVCLDIPWTKKTEDRIDTKEAQRILDRDHYGLNEVKERIVEYLSVLKLNPEMKGQIICLVGAPGVGKTSVASSIAKAMNRKFVRVSLGGIRDEADIRGHRKTYVASMPGRLVSSLIEAKVRNPLMLLDEVDKIASDIHGDPASALLEALDPDQNKAFRDHFVEIPVDLSDTVFICTANTTSTIPKPLLDRMEVIELHSYTREEKLEIAKKYLFTKEVKRHGLTKKIISLNDQAFYEIIDGYTCEAGVRNLDREIAKLLRKAAREYVEEKKSVFKIKPADIKDYLGARRYDPDGATLSDEVGIVNGLAYTEAGGELLKVEAITMPGSGKFEVTGSLGDVMKESAKIAFSIVRAKCSEYSIDPDFYKTKDIHVHFPEGAVPKDGPSAGVTLVSVLMSVLSGYKVRGNIAMTGEVTLSGKVIPIGGLREKTVAARKSKIKKVLVPYENRQDVERLDDYIKEGMEFVLCKTVDDVLKEALVIEDKTEKAVLDMFYNEESKPAGKAKNETEHRADSSKDNCGRQ